MKPALLAACFATAAGASAAELKDSAIVAREWEKTIAEAPMIKATPPGLSNQVQAPPVFPERTFEEMPRLNPKAKSSDRHPFGDGPLRPPEYDKDGHPRGAKPYRFNDDTYWLIPLTS
jgi:hypothetical protein